MTRRSAVVAERTLRHRESPSGRAVQRAQEIYDDIDGRTAASTDFDPSQLEHSRQYFDLSAREPRTRSFDVLTTLVGLPIPLDLQRAFVRKLDEIQALLPAETRVYRVRPNLLHWESHIIRRPGEVAPLLPMGEVARRFADAVAQTSAFAIEYRGFFVSPDGTIAFRGYGPTAELRASLMEQLPFSSLRQNETGHISVARILDPVGSDAFRRLLDCRSVSDTESLGTLPVCAVKLVAETRWYMEEHEVISEVPLKK